MSEAAARIALNEGAEGFTVAAIAAEAQVSTRTFHNYFNFREEPLIEFLGQQVRNVTAQLSTIPSDVCIVRALERLLSQGLSTNDSDYSANAVRLFQLADFLENSTTRDTHAALARELAPLVDHTQSRHPELGRFEASLVLRLLATAAIEALKEPGYHPRRSTPQQTNELLRRAFGILEILGKPTAQPAASAAVASHAGATDAPNPGQERLLAAAAGQG